MLLSNVNTHYSLLLGYAKPDELLKQCANREYKSCVLTDHNSLSGAVNFYKNAKKNKVKPIIGSRVTIINDKNQAFGQVNLYAKNKAGWFELIKLCSALYLNEEPSVTISQLRELKNVAAVLTGTGFISDEDSVYQIKDIFGKDFFVGFDTRNLKYGPNKSQLDLLKAIAEELNVYTLASPLVAYSNPEQKNDHLTLYSSHLGITSPEWAECADPNFAQFYNGDYSVPDKLDNLFSAGELNNLNRFNDLFEEYSILEKPSMPAFDCPNGMSEPDYLRQLCREGWTRKFGENPLSEHMKIKYGDRVKMELGVINKAGLDGYFLIVQDYVNWAKNQGWLIGPGRGCFLPDTRVKLSNNHYKPISLINVGDKVIDAFGNEQEVYDTLEYDIDEEIIELEFENGKIIRCTKDHKFLTKNRGWIEAQFLEDDDDIVEV